MQERIDQVRRDLADHIIDRMKRRRGLSTCGRDQMCPMTGPNNIGDQQSDQDSCNRVGDQKVKQARPCAPGDIRFHQGMDHSH